MMSDENGTACDLRVVDAEREVTIVVSIDYSESVSSLVALIAESREVDPCSIIPFVYGKDDLSYENPEYRHLIRKGMRIMLPDDWSVRRVLDELAHPDCDALGFLSQDMDQETIYRMRVNRFSQTMYDADMLAEVSVLIGGAGILGCEMAHGLATIGIRDMTIIDSGSVDWVNVRRQMLYDESSVYKAKAEAAALALSEFSGTTAVPLPLSVPYFGHIDSSDSKKAEFMSNWAALCDAVAQKDLVLGVFDKTSPRVTLQAACRLHSVPYITVATDKGIAQIVCADNDNDLHCYMCGNRISPVFDQGICTQTPLDLQKTACGLALRFCTEVLQNREMKYNACSLGYSSDGTLSYRYKRMGAAPECLLCGTDGLVERAGGNGEKMGHLLYEMYKNSSVAKNV